MHSAINLAGCFAPSATKTFTFPLDGIKPNRQYYLYIGHYHLHSDEFTTQLGTSQYFSLSATDIHQSLTTSQPQGTIYRIDGARVEDLGQKGVYIINGEKRIIK